MQQRKYIYFPNTQAVNPQDWYLSDMQVVTLSTVDQLKIKAWYKPAKPNQQTLLYFHGNASHLGARHTWVRPYLDAGYGLLLLSYRGYAGNPGQPSEEGLYNDARAAIQFLIEQKIPLQCIVLFGESLGTGVAIQLATEYEIGAVVLQSPYTSMVALGKYHYPWFPINLLLQDKFLSIDKISRIKSPILILVADEDVVVPIEQSKLIYDKANDPKQLMSYPKTAHNSIVSGQMVQDVIHFLQTHNRCSH